jgi:hypothetical protein
MKYTKAQYQACADLCNINAESVRQYVSKYKLDPTDPEAFQLQHSLLLKKKVSGVDKETEAAKKQRLVAQAKKEEVMLEKAEFDLAVSKGEYISIEEESALWSHVGLMTKTLMESMGREVAMMCEGKPGKEIQKVIDAKVAEILFQLSTIK